MTKFKIFAVLCVLCASAFVSSALDIITATISVTNAAGTTNGQTITVNANVRTWTNSVAIPASQVLTNATPTGAATNLFYQVAATPFSGLTLTRTTATNILLQTAPGGPLAVTLSTGWGTVTYSTQALVSATVVRIPNTVENAPQRTNVASGVIGWINDTSGTNEIQQASKAATQLLGTTNTQTITGNKTFTGTVIVTNRAGAVFIGTVNFTNLVGDVGSISNGIWYAATLVSPTITNGVNYGSAFRSAGSGAGSQQFGSFADSAGDNSMAIGVAATASGLSSIALGSSSAANSASTIALGSAAAITGDYSVGIGNASSTGQELSVALGYQASTLQINSFAGGALSAARAPNSTSLGYGATVDATHTNSVAIGATAFTLAKDEIRLGAATHHVSIPGALQVEGAIQSFNAGSTNNFPVQSDIAFGRFAVTSLANGNNAAVPIGTNVFVEVSGPSAAFTLNGINAGGAMRDGKLLVIVNQTGFDMTLAHQSGTDPAAANRIINMTGADRTTTGNGSATLLYSGSASRWILIAFDP